MPKHTDSKDKKKKKRNVMKEFKMTELSAVDRPAQAGAISVLMKRDDAVKKKVSLTSDNDGHSHLVDIDEFTMARSGGHTGWNDDHSHPFSIDANGSITIGMSDDHTHTIDMTADEIVAKSADVGNTPGGDPMPKPENADLEKSVKALEKKLKDTEDALAKSNTISEFTDGQKTFMNSLSKADKTSYLAKSFDERNADIELAKADDPVVYTSDDGCEFLKSDDSRLVAMAKKADQNAKLAIVEKTKREFVELTKRAEDEFGDLPGKNSTHAVLLKAIDGFDEDIRKDAMAIMKSKVSGLKKAKETLGSTGSNGDKSAEDELDTLAKKMAKEDSISFEVAYGKVLETDHGANLVNKTFN